MSGSNDWDDGRNENGWDNDHDENDRYDDDDRQEDSREYQSGQSLSNERYQFNITGGQVTGVVEYENGITKTERMEWDEQWIYRDGQVVKTELDDGYLETTIYADSDGDGFFTKISEGHDKFTSQYSGVKISDDQARYVNDQYVGDDNWAEGYRFTIQNGSISQVVEVDDGRERVEIPDWNESWVVQGSNVMKIETYQAVTETSVYSDLDGDGIYSKMLEQYGASGSSVPSESQLSNAIANAQQGLITVYGDEGIADDIFLTYEAAFNREADAEGLGYWIAQAKQGQNLTEIANNFLLSKEFSTRYGDSISDEDFVEALYQNILDRSSDTDGHEYWVQNLSSGQDNRAEVLASFAISSENVTNLADDLAAGIQYSTFIV